MTQYVLAVGLGALFAAGTFLLLRRDVIRVVWGVTLMAQGANVYLVTMGGIAPGDVAPIVHEGTEGVTDPLVQALVLTAIVIGFGTTAFALALTYRVYQEHGTVDTFQVGREDAFGASDATQPVADGAGTPADRELDDQAAAEPPADGAKRASSGDKAIRASSGDGPIRDSSGAGAAGDSSDDGGTGDPSDGTGGGRGG